MEVKRHALAVTFPEKLVEERLRETLCFTHIRPQH
jgi:hypothetical protein